MQKQKQWFFIASLFFILLSPAWAKEPGTPLPSFNMHTLNDSQLSNKTFVGKVSLLNVWGSWCKYCMYEHGMLLKIKKNYDVPIYSIALKDDPADTKAVLKRKGNPYVEVGEDPEGIVSDKLNIYGTPETFVIDKKGRIRYKHNGAVDQASWDNKLWPLIQKLQAEK